MEDRVNQFFLGKLITTTGIWKEWEIQAYVIMMARRHGLVVHGDQNGASKSRSSAARAKATGMLAGWPDLCFILENGPLWVELKRGKGGKLSDEQVELHETMRKSGCRVEVVYANCPADCWKKVQNLVLGVGLE